MKLIGSEKFYSVYKERINKFFNNTNNVKYLPFYISKYNDDTIHKFYIDSFDNNIKQSYVCNNCFSTLDKMNFIFIDNKEYKPHFIFDVSNPYADEYEKIVIPKLNNKIKQYYKENGLYSGFVSLNNIVGVSHNIKINENGETIKFSHFNYKVPSKFVIDDDNIDSFINQFNEHYKMFKYIFEKWTVDGLQLIKDFINNIYRGKEFLYLVDTIYNLLNEYNNLPTNEQKRNFVYYHTYNLILKEMTMILKIKNTAIGELINDIVVDNVDINKAIYKYEKMVAPTNYRRVSPIVTPKMIEDAKKKIEELGYLKSFDFTTVKPDDISIKNVLWIKNSQDKIDNIFDEIFTKSKEEETKNVERLKNRVKTISKEEFINNILPKSKEIKIYVENKYKNRFVTLLKQKNNDSKPIFKWGNKFNWSYIGNVADSNILEKVKKMGGRDGDLRFSLEWWGDSDYDIHLEYQSFTKKELAEIYYGQRHSYYLHGELDVDMNVHDYGDNFSMNAVENIVFDDINKIPDGIYRVFIHNYTRRNNHTKPGFSVEAKISNKKYLFKYDKLLKVNEKIDVCVFKVRNHQVQELEPLLKEVFTDNESITIWNIKSKGFRDVDMILYSPNYWENSTKSGNKHLLFKLKNCKFDKEISPFYIEQIDNQLNPIRKAITLVSNKLKIQPVESQYQISGLGFSETQNEEVLFKVKIDSIEMLYKVVL